MIYQVECRTSWKKVEQVGKRVDQAGKRVMMRWFFHVQLQQKKSRDTNKKRTLIPKTFEKKRTLISETFTQKKTFVVMIKKKQNVF